MIAAKVRYLTIWVCIFSLVGLAVNGARAAQKIRHINPYVVTVEVQDKSHSAREKAISHALEEVFVKVTGLPDSLTQLKSHVKHADQALLQYRYLQPTAFGQTFALELTFDKAVVQRWLGEAQIKPWPLARPVVLVWATLDEVPEGIEASQQSLHSQFEQHALRYGLPLQFPIMDIDEISEFSIKDIIFTNQQNLKTLSKRYQSDILLTAHLSYQFASDEWVCNWALLIGDEVQHWQSRHRDLNKLIGDAVGQSTTHIASSDLKPSNEHWVTVKVRDIRSSQDTNRVLDYLRTLSHVADVEIKSLNNSEVQYQISYKADLDKLKSDIENGAFLQAATISSSSEELLYDYLS